MLKQVKEIVFKNPVLSIGLLVTLLVYARFLSFGHISWDDPEMIFKNKAVRSFDLSALLTHHFVGNYIPLTMLTHAFAWLLFKTHDGGHHAVNILFHLINGILVYRVGKVLLKKEQVATLCSILFLLHPIQIESVGWISELKTVLSTTFYLSGILFYLRYLEHSKKTDLVYTFLFFVGGCLSKSSVVVFPLSLICIDLLFYNRISYKFLIDKIPFFLLSVAFGIINIKTQAADLFINYSHEFPYYERVGFAGYALLKYVSLFLLPINLSVIYPYPPNSAPALITGYTFILALVVTLIVLFRKKNYVVTSLILFTLANLILVLQFIPFGEVLYADRYMYIPTVGFGWIFSTLLFKASPSYKIPAGILIVLLAIASFTRSNVWRSGITLYEDILRNFPNSFVALNSVGVEYMLQDNTEKALYYLNKSIQVSPQNYKGFYNRGLLYLKNQQPELAIKSFDESLKIYDYTKAYVGRGSAQHLTGNIPKAMADAKHVLAINNNNPNAHFILGNCYNDLNKLDDALKEYTTCIDLNSDEADYYFKRAIVFGKKQDFTMCISDITTSLQLNPLLYEAYYWRAVAKVNLRQNACDDFRIAAQQNYKPAVDAYNKYCR